MLTIDHFSFHYPNGKGLDDVSFEARGVLGVLGKNGAGKSTLFQGLMGYLPGCSGRVLWQGQPEVFPRTEWGYLPAVDYFMPRLSVRQNWEYLGFLRLGREKAWTTLKPWVEELGMENELNTRFQECSTGTKKKAQLLASLLGTPRVILWDEPQNGVDLVANDGVSRLTKRLAQSGTVVITASHIAESLAATCDALLVLRDGRSSSPVGRPFPEPLVSLLSGPC